MFQLHTSTKNKEQGYYYVEVLVCQNKIQKILRITHNDTEEFMQKNRDEVHTNRKFFESILDDIIKEHRDEFVLVKSQKVIGYFPTYGEAREMAETKISDNLYSIHKVTDEALDLGFFSNATI